MQKYGHSPAQGNLFIEDLEDNIIFNSVSIRKIGMRIPVMAGYHFDFTDAIKNTARASKPGQVFYARKHSDVIDDNEVEIISFSSGKVVPPKESI